MKHIRGRCGTLKLKGLKGIPNSAELDGMVKGVWKRCPTVALRSCFCIRMLT